MFGSGGSDVAARVAGALGWDLYDNAVIDAVAQRLGLPPAEVSAQDERVPSMVERLAEALAFGTPESMPAVADRTAPPTEEEIVRVTARVIEEAVQRGPAVFVGRGAQCLLAERADALHVYCYAEPASLLRYAMAHRGLDAANAERVVADVNRQREQYVRRHWGRNWRSLENYHVCLNTGVLGIEASAALVISLARSRLRA